MKNLKNYLTLYIRWKIRKNVKKNKQKNSRLKRKKRKNLKNNFIGRCLIWISGLNRHKNLIHGRLPKIKRRKKRLIQTNKHDEWSLIQYKTLSLSRWNFLLTLLSLTILLDSIYSSNLCILSVIFSDYYFFMVRSISLTFLTKF